MNECVKNDLHEPHWIVDKYSMACVYLNEDASIPEFDYQYYDLFDFKEYADDRSFLDDEMIYSFEYYQQTSTEFKKITQELLENQDVYAIGDTKEIREKVLKEFKRLNAV